MPIHRGHTGKSTAQRPTRGLRMHMVLAVTALLTALLVVSGCSSSSGSHVVYVAGGLTSVATYRINNGSGSVGNLVGSPYVAGNSPSSVVVHPSGQYVYVANQADSTISLFTADPGNGTLTEVLPRTSGFGLSPAFMTMDVAGHFLFVANAVSNDVWAFSIGSGGVLTAVSSAPIGSAPGGLVLFNGFLIVPVPNFSDIAVVSVSNTGVLQFVNSYPVTNGVGGIAVSSAAGGIVGGPPAGFVYATNPGTGTVSAFAIQPGGALQAMPGLTIGAGTTPVAAAVDSSGSFLYVANAGSANVSQYKVNLTTGALTAFSTPTVAGGTNPVFMATDPQGKFVYEGNTGAQSITEFSINSDGSLNNLNTISPGFVPRGFAASP